VGIAKSIVKVYVLITSGNAVCGNNGCTYLIMAGV